MTNAERAEKIANEIYKCSHVMSCQNIEDLITSQLDEAVREAREEQRQICGVHQNMTYSQGFAIAREQAAGIAENLDYDYADDRTSKRIAARIRGMKP